jgi:dynein heavy chain
MFTISLICRAPDEIIQYLEEHLAQISTMKGTRHVKPFQNEVDYWEKSIAQISELCEGLFNIQRQWLYMEGIFTSDDAQKQLSREAAEFKYINRIWQEEIVAKIRENPNAFYVATKLSSCKNLQTI